MASYFEEHGIDNNNNRKDATQTPVVNYHDFLGLGESNNDITEPMNSFLALAKLIRQGEYQDFGQQILIDNLVTQLLEEANESSKGPPPASESFIKGLTVLTEDKLSPNAGCSICTEPLAKKSSDNQVVELPCKHQYDRDCLVPWLELHNTCPVCRKEVPSDDPEWLKKQRELDDDTDKDWLYG